MATRQLARTVAVLFWAGLLGAGCGSSSAPASGQGAGSGDKSKPPSPAAQRRQNACDLLDREDIEKITGKKLTMLNNIEDADQTTCELAPEGTPDTIMYVKVYWAGGKEMARIEQAAMGMAKAMLNEPGVDIEKLTGSGGVKGLADAAYYSELMPSWVLKGDVFIQLLMPLFTRDQSTRAFTAVTTKALARLPAGS